MGFPDSSVGKESACNAGNRSWIPGLGRSPEEGIGYPLQYSGAFLVSQVVKNLPAMWETGVRSLGWEDPLENSMDCKSTGSQRVSHDWATFTFMCVLSCVRLFATLRTVAHQAPQSMGFSRQEYWSGLPFPSPGELPDPGIEPMSPALQADPLTSEPPGQCYMGIGDANFYPYSLRVSTEPAY